MSYGKDKKSIEQIVANNPEIYVSGSYLFCFIQCLVCNFT
jgi:hypothetical protein